MSAIDSTPSLRPVALGTAPSFGFGDRLGCATPGHLRALREQGGSIAGVFAQQSIREMARTDRTPQEVMFAAFAALSAAGHADPWGADADHLKTPEDVARTAEAGFVFFTIDPSDHVDEHADDYDPATVEAKYTPQPWVERYFGQTREVAPGVTIDFDELTVKRAAVKYGPAIRHAIDLAAEIADETSRLGRPHEVEISVDETEQPTTLAEHYLFAEQLLEAGVNLVSLAPRFIGELEKGVDYKGDLDALERSLERHAAVARALRPDNPYKLSLHSGSDKLSMYTRFARATRGRLHVKTAGTSYLEALRVAARHDPPLFREIVDFSRGRYDADKATYHVSATLDVPAPADVADDRELERLYLETWDGEPTKADPGEPGSGFTLPGRQIVHCTFGSVLTHEKLGPALKQVLDEHPDTYEEVLALHFGKHLAALTAGM